MKKNGFTLIELMVVGAIIGVMAAIAVEGFASKPKEAKAASVIGAYGFTDPKLVSKSTTTDDNGGDCYVFNYVATNASERRVSVNALYWPEDGTWKVQVP